jgi:hypothetical protein
MSYKVTIAIDDDELDAITVKSLQEVYQDCIETINNPNAFQWEDVEDAVKRMAGASTLLSYYMVPQEYKKYVKYYENYIKNITRKPNEKNKDTGAAD